MNLEPSASLWSLFESRVVASLATICSINFFWLIPGLRETEFQHGSFYLPILTHPLGIHTANVTDFGFIFVKMVLNGPIYGA
jgi:hypothetical protein